MGLESYPSTATTTLALHWRRAHCLSSWRFSPAETSVLLRPCSRPRCQAIMAKKEGQDSETPSTSQSGSQLKAVPADHRLLRVFMVRWIFWSRHQRLSDAVRFSNSQLNASHLRRTDGITSTREVLRGRSDTDRPARSRPGRISQWQQVRAQSPRVLLANVMRAARSPAINHRWPHFVSGGAQGVPLPFWPGFSRRPGAFLDLPSRRVAVKAKVVRAQGLQVPLSATRQQPQLPET